MSRSKMGSGRRGLPPMFTPEEDKENLALYEIKKLSSVKIAKMRQCSADAIRSSIIRAGGTMRDRSAARLGIPLENGRCFNAEKDAEIWVVYKEERASTYDLAERYGVSYQAINAAIVRAGGKLRTGGETIRLKDPEEEIDIAASYACGNRMSSVCKFYGITRRTLDGILKRHGVEKRYAEGVFKKNGQRMGEPRCSLNHKAFENAELSPVASFFVGLMYTDGNIKRRGNRGDCFSLTTCEEDSYMVYSFKEFLGSSHKAWHHVVKCGYKIGAKAVKLSINSSRIVDDLERYGIIERKSLIADVVPVMRNNVDFWLGAITGDGWVSDPSSDNKVIGLSGNRKTCERFLEFVRPFTKTTASVNADKDYWRAQVSSSCAFRLAKVLYYDGHPPSLTRKEENARQLIEYGNQKGWS